MKWTKEQQSAIDFPVSDIIVSAAAGSGKTAVMSERIINRLTEEDFVDIDRILVVTYTKAAASEIRERVMKKIMDKISDGADHKLSMQLIKLPNSHFCTIHSFCLDLIKKNFFRLGIDPNVKIADEPETEMLKQNAVSYVLNRAYESNDENFKKISSFYYSKNDVKLSNLILSTYDFSRTMPDSEKWLKDLSKPYENADIINQTVDILKQAASYARAKTEYAIELCEKYGIYNSYIGILSSDIEIIDGIFSKNNYDEAFKYIKSINYARWAQDKSVDPMLSSRIKKIRDEAKSCITDITKKYFVYTLKQLKSVNDDVIVVLNQLIKLVTDFSIKFDELKRESNFIDFSDFEHMTLKLLKNDDGTPSDVAAEVSESFDEIYIDEYQDCNNIQNEIFKYISGEHRGHPNIFCVGDMKQSIYSFRDANPLLFKEKSNLYALYDYNKYHKHNKILLNSNFRSRKNIIDFVNSLFYQTMSPSCGELEYNNEEMLVYGSDFEEVNSDTQFIDVDIIDKDNGFCGENGKSDFKLSKTEAEAVHVANKIQKYISDGYILYDRKSKNRRIAKYRDIVVLMRGVKNTAPVFERIFKKMGIPVYSDKGEEYFESKEIIYLISLLKVIDNPDDDISLVTSMKNPFFGFDENDFMEIRMINKNTSFYKCICEYMNTFDGNLSDKIARFIKTVNDFNEKSRYMETDELINYVIAKIRFYTYLSTFADSELKKTNVRFLIKKAKDFEKTNYKGIFSFIRYIDNLRASDKSKTEGAKILSENDNVVRIMSIHKSKGLEFPIVFLTCLGSKIMMKDDKNTALYHSKYGIGLDSYKKDKVILKTKTLNKIVMRQKKYKEYISEEMRVLYVALTRPTEKLVLSGVCSNADKMLNNTEYYLCGQGKKINPYIISKANNYMQVILFGITRSSGYQADLMQYNLTKYDDSCKYNVSLINMNSITLDNTEQTDFDWQKLFDKCTDSFEQINKMLSYEYPYKVSSALPSNMTVTEIKRMYDDESAMLFDSVNLDVPKNFSVTHKIYGAALGTIVHKVMEKLDFSNITDENNVISQLRMMTENKILNEDEFNALPVNKIKRFCLSSLAKRMQCNNDTLKKEFSFKIMIDSNEIFPGAKDDRMIIQGTVDAFFTDADGSIVIIDYKTDSASKGNSAEIAAKYKVQVDLYAKALEKILNVRVKEKIIYIFDTAEEFAF